MEAVQTSNNVKKQEFRENVSYKHSFMAQLLLEKKRSFFGYV